MNAPRWLKRWLADPIPECTDWRGHAWAPSDFGIFGDEGWKCTWCGAETSRTNPPASTGATS